MNDTQDSRFRTRFILIAVILATLPCYCTGFALVRISNRPGPQRPTPTPLWAQQATQTAAAATSLIPSFTPVFVTATPPTPATLFPTRTATFTPSPSPSASPTLLPSASATATLFPSDTPTATATETLPPTVTFTATPPEPTTTDTPAAYP